MTILKMVDRTPTTTDLLCIEFILTAAILHDKTNDSEIRTRRRPYPLVRALNNVRTFHPIGCICLRILFSDSQERLVTDFQHENRRPCTQLLSEASGHTNTACLSHVFRMVFEENVQQL